MTGDGVARLENAVWQAGVLPGTGASLAYGRVKGRSGAMDVLRPTPPEQFGNSSGCSSFVMLPWCNRIKDGVLRFRGERYRLRTTKDDGTARHGDTRGRAWTVESADGEHIRLSLRSADYPDLNWPFRFTAEVVYRLEGGDFIWEVRLRNTDTRSFPAGFGHHPYFVRTEDVLVRVPCAAAFELTDFMATGAAVPIPARLDFRQRRGLDTAEINDVLTGRTVAEPAEIVYPSRGITVEMHSEAIFEQILLFAPAGKDFFAVEPMTNVSDGFNLFEDGIPGSGVFVLEPGESASGRVRLRAKT